MVSRARNMVSRQTSLARTEGAITALQALVALTFCIGCYVGLFDVPSPTRELVVGWIVVWHVVVDTYSVRYRMRGERIWWFDPTIPFFDLTCATSAYLALGDPLSPVWAIHLYALVGYARRYQGWGFVLVGGWVIVSWAGAWLLMGGGINPAFVTVLIMSVAVAALSRTIGSGWKDAERRVRELAETDPLTGLANRRTFFERLPAVARPCAILMLDLDNFKGVNDEAGHQHGDRVLMAVGEILRTSTRATDLVARYGGEEFIVAMPNATIEEAGAAGERIRLGISRAGETTVSIGCAILPPGGDPDGAIRRADDLLLAAKRNGKDSVWAGEMRLVA